MTRRELILSLSSLTTLSPVPQLRTSTRGLPIIEIDAGPLSRTHTLVHFTLPTSVRGDPLQLRNEATQTTLPLQITSDRTAWFILDSLPAGETRRLTIEPALVDTHSLWPAEALQERDALVLRIQQKLVARFQIERTPPPRTDIDPSLQRTAYLHPVRTPSGRTVTDDYPPTAPEHHGIWTAWGKSAFQGRTPDFWNMAARTGRVEFEALLTSWSGHIHSGFRSRHRLVDLTTATPITALTELWEVRTYAVNQQDKLRCRIIDVTAIHEAATNDTVTLLQEPYGGFAVRGRQTWNRSSQRRTLAGWTQTPTTHKPARARWCYMGRHDNRESTGIAVLSAPSNRNAPLHLHLHANEPFFCFTPVPAEKLDIVPGQPLITRMRVLAIDGTPDRAWLDQQWQEYANPVIVRT